MNAIDEVIRSEGSRETSDIIIGASTIGLGEYLTNEKKLPNAAAFEKLRDESIRILRRCGRFGGADQRHTGLVVGYVQSGKTMSMTAVSALARDNGCRIIVLLAGVTTNLLRQNATRFRDTLRSSADGREHWLIVNSEDGHKRASDKEQLRQAVEEWRDPSIESEDQRTIFFAVLKNHAHLAWLRGILQATSLSGIPALIIDDEADQAGLNVRPNADEASTTYRMIEEVRAALPHHTYLQYTATPQAPLLINIDDKLSPEFAELVEPGDGYTGGKTFFAKGADPSLVKRIPAADLFDAGSAPDDMPQSLKDALAVFFVGCAVARERRKPTPRSMLVHPSALKADHKKFSDWIDAIRSRWADSLKDTKNGDDREDTLAEMRRGYDELAKNATLPSFDGLINHIGLGLRRVAVKIVNSEDGTEVDWDNNEEHILVGGEKLNRGFTVEGLTVTYMPRDPGGWNADTIQQRARFFGYKKSYLDLCRLYLHPKVENAFRQYVDHEEDIRRQLAEHRGKPLRVWRRAFFLDRKMKPTRANVLSDPLYRVSADQVWFEQRFPHTDPQAALGNAAKVREFLDSVPRSKQKERFHHHLVGEAPLSQVLEKLLFDYKAPDDNAWLGQLVYLADLLSSSPDERVCIIEMKLANDRGKDRERGTEKGLHDGAIRLHQGEAGSRKKSGSGYPGDDEMFDVDRVTLQIYFIDVKDGRRHVPAIALRIPHRRADAIAQKQGG